MTNEAGERKKCFVVMGFGEKIDFASNPQRKLNLDRTYYGIIEPAVKECGVDCIRADKIIHSTVIDKPMYDYLLEADLVIADLSTSNANAIYELGVRHALRPHATIVMAEKGFAFPFDLNHVSILQYKHLGEDIGLAEALEVRDKLMARIRAVLERPETDSPVFLFRPELLGQNAPPAPAQTEAPRDNQSFADLMENLQHAKAAVSKPQDWLKVTDVLNRLLNLQPNDAYIIQQLALATYKSKKPDAITALVNAKKILEPLLPETSSDSETVGIWGAIHKRLWEIAAQADDLAKAIRAYARGYFIRNDYYNGINFAFLLNERAAKSQGDEAVADRVQAKRVRAEVLGLCDAALATGTLKADDLFWVGATQAEALLGLGQKEDSEKLRHQILTEPPNTPDATIAAHYNKIYVPPAGWMRDTMSDQLTKLAALKP